MYLLKRAFSALFLSLLCFAAYAQQTVTGTVKDATGEPMIGVTVLADGKAAAVTDFDGNFSVPNATPSTVIKVSYVGYEDQVITVNNSRVLNIVMRENSETLEEVVVVGYGTMKKSDLTGAISSVNSDDIVAKGASSVLGAMQGAVAGVNITQSSGRPGGSMDIEIRGKSSINSDVTPLFVVDGIVCDDIDFLNEQDIEKIDILKDASSTAIYGSRATAGVVIVTTKGGTGSIKATKPTISYDGYYGIAVPSRFADFMDAEEYYNFRFGKFLYYAMECATPVLAMGNFGQMALQYDSSDASKGYYYKDFLQTGKSYNWPEIVTQNGRQQNHYISASGSTEHVKYNLGLGYNDEEGVYIGDEKRKFSFKLGLDADINKYVSVGFDFKMAYIDQDYASDDAVSNSYTFVSAASPWDENGEIITMPFAASAFGTDSYQFSGSNYSALLYLQNAEANSETWRLMGNVHLDIKPFDCLTFRTSFSPNYTHYRYGEYEGTLTGAVSPTASLEMNREFSYTWENVLTFEKIFNEKHRVNIMGMFSVEAYDYEDMYTEYSDVYEGTTYWNLEKIGIDNVSSASSDYSEYSMMSYALRGNYTFLDRYMITATIRWDGSSRFTEGNRWGSFPSVALAWRASEENFIKEKAPWISNLKLRLSYGVTGNNAGIGNYDYMVTVDGPVYYPFGSTYYTGMYPSGIVDEDLKWEKSTEWNLGIDFGFLNNRISGSIDLYTKKSKDLLYDVTLPYEVGGLTMTTNVGSVRNKGIEVSLTGNIIRTKDWNWTITANYSHNSNHVKQIDGYSTSLLSGSTTGNLFIGSSVNNLYTYVTDGIVTDKDMTVPNNEAAISNGFTPGETVKEYDYYYTIYGWTEGNPKVKDLDGDGDIDDNDKKVFRCDPAWTGSLSTNLSYKGWDFNISIYTKQHFWVYSNFYNSYSSLSRSLTRLNHDFYIAGGTLIDCDGVNADGTYINPVYQEYTHYGTYASLNNSGTSNGTNNSYWVSAVKCTEVSFTKVKNITLGYTFPKVWTQKFGCQKLRLYVTVTNPFVITGYDGPDPEWADAERSDVATSVTTWQFGANIRF